MSTPGGNFSLTLKQLLQTVMKIEQQPVPILRNSDQKDCPALLRNLQLLLNGERIAEQNILKRMSAEKKLKNEVMNEDKIIQSFVQYEKEVTEKKKNDEEKISHAEEKTALKLIAKYTNQ